MCVRPAPQEELPQRFENAERAFVTKLWREDLRRWDEEAKPASIRAHLALQRVDPWALSDQQLLEHLVACYAHLGRMFEQHYRLVAPALLPTGDFIAQISELSGTSPAELLVLTRGSAPVSSGAEDGLKRLAEAIRDDEEAGALLGSGDPPAEILAALRARPGATGAATNAYLEMVECRLIDGFDVGCPCGFELPEVLVQAIRRGVEGLDREGDAAEETERVRERVPSSERGRFNELLAEARHTYRLRDERSIYSSVWAMGLMRRAILAAGERLAAQGRIEQPAHLVDATYDELLSMLRGGRGPSAAEFAALSHFRITHTATEAPQLLGDPPHPPPPLERLPAAAARATRGMITAVGLVFRDAEAASEASVVRGLPASSGVYEGTARVLRGPEELQRLRQGDVLVTPATSEAFNVVLPLLVPWSPTTAACSPTRRSSPGSSGSPAWSGPATQPASSPTAPACGWTAPRARSRCSRDRQRHRSHTRRGPRRGGAGRQGRAARRGDSRRPAGAGGGGAAGGAGGGGRGRRPGSDGRAVRRP